MSPSKLEAQLANDLALLGRAIPPWKYQQPVREHHPFWCCDHQKYKHHEGRRWPRPFCSVCDADHAYAHERDFRVDFAWPEAKVACEVEGVVWVGEGGRHQRAAGFSKDLEKYTSLELAGWHVVRVGPAQIKDGTAITLIERALDEASRNGSRPLPAVAGA